MRTRNRAGATPVKAATAGRTPEFSVQALLESAGGAKAILSLRLDRKMV